MASIKNSSSVLLPTPMSYCWSGTRYTILTPNHRIDIGKQYWNNQWRMVLDSNPDYYYVLYPKATTAGIIGGSILAIYKRQQLKSGVLNTAGFLRRNSIKIGGTTILAGICFALGQSIYTVGYHDGYHAGIWKR